MIPMGRPVTLDVEGKGRCLCVVSYKRIPLRGEYYLSGAKPSVYLAPSNLSTEYHIVNVLRKSK